MSQNLSFEDVLDELMLEEPAPSYEALLRWSERYPQYRKDLAEFFATWTIQSMRPEEPEKDAVDGIDEAAIIERGVSYALRLLRQQGRILPETPVESLKPFEQRVLTAIYLLRGKGDVVTITDKVIDMFGDKVFFGSTFTAVDNLNTLGLVSSWMSDPKTEPDGQARKYFAATPAGERVLQEAKVTSKLLADFLGDFA